MNILLLSESELNDIHFISTGSNEYLLQGTQAHHVVQVLRAQVGDEVKVGRINKGLSTAQILEVGSGRVRLLLSDAWVKPVMAARPRLILGLPRPKVFRRMLRQAVILGFKQIHICHSYRVEKSFWQSPLLEQQILDAEITAGLQQAQDIYLPQIEFHRYFKPFFQDQVSQWVEKGEALCAHPYSSPWGQKATEVELMALGPEGGWIDYELEIMSSIGMKSYSFSERTLSCETALPYISGKLF